MDCMQLLPYLEAKLMKNQSFSINEMGFILPSVTFIIFILFILLSTNIAIYKQDVDMANNHIKQIKIETLIQLALDSYKAELRASDDFINHHDFTISYGEVILSASENTQDDTIIIDMRIKLSEKHIYHTDFIISSLND